MTHEPGWKNILAYIYMGSVFLAAVIWILGYVKSQAL